MSRRLSLTLLAVMALAAALVVPNMAPAATKKVRTKITIGHSGSRLTGKVKSRKATCRKGRRVVVYRGSRAVGPKSRTITIGGGGGGGGTTTLSTKLTIRFAPGGPYTGGAFSGTVGSPESACISGRTVSVYLQGSSTAIGSDTSSSNGSWSVQAPPSLQTGQYLAKTPAKGINAGTCDAGQSPTVSAP